MDKVWTWRDWIFLLLFLCLFTLIFLAMKQSDRLYERLNDLITITKDVKALASRGGLTHAPGGDNTTAAPDTRPTGDWCVVHLRSEPATLNPITAKDAYAGYINTYILEGLMERNPQTLKFEPRLCESYAISESGLEYTFNLRKGVTWHDDVPFTADDVIYSFNVMMDNQTDCQNVRNYYADISVKKLGDYQVRFTSKKKYWRAFINCAGLSIVPKHLFEKDKGPAFNSSEWGRKPVGTGPYKFVRWDAKQKVVLERNPNYWFARRTPHIDRIVFKFITDETAAMEAVKKQEIDDYEPTAEQWMREATESIVTDHFRRMKFNGLFFNYIGWNEKTVFFQDRRVRLAMTYSVPREEILKYRLYDLGSVVSGPFYVNSDAYDRSIEPWPYDLDKARRLLDEAGWKDTNGDGIRDKNGKAFRFQLLVPQGRMLYRDIAVRLLGELKKIGVEMSLRELDWASFIKELDDQNFEAVSLGWSLSLEEDPYQLWHSSQTGASGSNFVWFSSAEADKLIEESRSEFDEAKRNVLFRRLHRILHEEQPYTFLFNRPTLELLNQRFENVKEYPLGTDLLDWYVKPENQKYK